MHADSDQRIRTKERTFYTPTATRESSSPSGGNVGYVVHIFCFNNILSLIYLMHLSFAI